MKIIKTLILLFTISLVSCNSQDKEITNAKILDLDSLYQIFLKVNEIDTEGLKERLPYISKDKVEKLQNSISKHTLNAKIIELYKENFTTKEINELHKDSEDYFSQDRTINTYNYQERASNLSKELKEKKFKALEILRKEDDLVFEDFKNKIYRLDSINYETSESKNIKKGISKKHQKKANGIYEVLSYDEQERNSSNFTDTFVIKDEPGMAFNNLKEIDFTLSSNPSLNYRISVTFNKDGAREFKYLTQKNQKKYLAILIDDNIVITPFVESIIDDGKIDINGKITYSDAINIVDNIKKERALQH